MRFTIGILGILVACTASEQLRDAYPPAVTAKCIHVIDGDTIVCIIDGKIEKVRLIGINTPEKRQPKWKEARDYVRNLCLDKDIRIEFDMERRDRYGRLLGYVFSQGEKDGGKVFINKELLCEGHAKYFGFFSTSRYDEVLKSCLRAMPQ